MDSSKKMNQSCNAWAWLYLDLKNSGVAGGMFTPCISGETKFIGLDGFLLTLDSVFDEIEYPQRYMARCRLDCSLPPVNEEIKRRLREPAPISQMREKFKQHEGQHLLCVSIQVEQRKHATWQGSLTLFGRCEAVRFESVMELVRILRAAVNAASKTGDQGRSAFCRDEERAYEMHWA